MKNKKIILIFMLIIAFLLVMATFVQATGDLPLNIADPNRNNTTGNEQSNNNQVNNNTPGPVIGNTTNNNTTNNTTNNTATNTLPQTGVAEDTALFVFIAVCIISAIYAFVRIRNYKNI